MISKLQIDEEEDYAETEEGDEESEDSTDDLQKQEHRCSRHTMTHHIQIMHYITKRRRDKTQAVTSILVSERVDSPSLRRSFAPLA